MSDIKDKLKEIEIQRQQMMEQQQQQEQQLEMQKTQVEMQMKGEENRIKEEDSIRKSATQIQVALIKEEGNEGDTEVEVPEDDPIEREKLTIQKDKERHDYEIKKKQADEVARKNRMAERQKSEEISIKRKVANKPQPKSN